MFFPRCDFSISDTYILYFIGERIAPWGTSALISMGGVSTVPTTAAVLSSKKLEKILRILVPYSISQANFSNSVPLMVYLCKYLFSVKTFAFCDTELYLPLLEPRLNLSYVISQFPWIFCATDHLAD